MKKFTLIFFGILFGFSVFSQKGTELFNVDFSGSFPPSGWTIENLQSQWAQSSSANAGGEVPEARLTYTNGNTTTRMISPTIDLTGLSSVLFSFKHFLDDYSGTGYSIGAATRSGGGNWNIVWSVNPSGNVGPETNDLLISNSDVGASDFQICLYVSGNMYNFDYWYIDDLILISPDNNDAETASINFSPYAAAGDIDIDFTFKNSGINTITSIDVNYQIDEGSVITENLSGLSLETTDTYDHTFTTPWTATPGNYELKVWVSNMNGIGDDDDPGNDLLVQNMSIATQSVQNMPIFEEFTSSTCPPCATFNTNTFTPFMNAHPDDITVVKYQMSWPAPGDPYYTAEGGTRRYYYGVSFVPDLYTGGVNTATTSTGVNTAYSNEMSKPAFFEINATHQINGNNISVQTDITSFITAQNFTVHMAVIEKLTTGNEGSNGETSFKNVMMKMLPNADGTTIDFNADIHTFLSETYDMSSTNVEEMGDLAVVIFIQNNETKEIFQSAYSVEDVLPAPDVSFLPADGATDVEYDTDIKICFNQSMRFVDDSEITDLNISDFVTLTDPTKADIPYTATINDSKSLITIVPDAALPESTVITIGIDDAEIEGVNDVALTGTSTSFTTGAYPYPEVEFDPSNGETNVSYNTDVVLSFDMPIRHIDDSEITNGDIAAFVSLTDPTKANIPFTATINAGKTIITISPDNVLPELTEITVTIAGDAVENEFDKVLAEIYAVFTTTSYPLPEVVFDPANGETDVTASTNISLTFDAPMRHIDDSEITDGDIDAFVSLTDPNKSDIPFTATINPGKTVITIDPVDNLPGLTDITVTISGNAIENEYDKAMGETSATFTTEDLGAISNLLNSVKVYPNPAFNNVFISDAENAVFTLIDVFGKVVKTQIITSDKESIDLSDIKTGLYVIKLEYQGVTTKRKMNVIK